MGALRSLPWTIRVLFGLGGMALAVLVLEGLSPPTSGPHLSARARARFQMEVFAYCVAEYRRSEGRLPPDLRTLTEPSPDEAEAWIESIPPDPWGTPYRYRVFDPSEYEIRSAGPDRQDGTDDDLRLAG